MQVRPNCSRDDCAWSGLIAVPNDAKLAPCKRHAMSSRVWWTWLKWGIFWGAEPSIGWEMAIQIGPFNYLRERIVRPSKAAP